MDEASHSVQIGAGASSPRNQEASLLGLDIKKLYRKCVKRKNFKLLEKWFQECFSSLDNVLISFQKANSEENTG